MKISDGNINQYIEKSLYEYNSDHEPFMFKMINNDTGEHNNRSLENSGRWDYIWYVTEHSYNLYAH